MAGVTSNTNPCGVVEATEEEGRTLFDRAVKDGLGISGEPLIASEIRTPGASTSIVDLEEAGAGGAPSD